MNHATTINIPHIFIKYLRYTKSLLENYLAFLCDALTGKKKRTKIFETILIFSPSNHKFLKGGATLINSLEREFNEHHVRLLKLAYTYVKSRAMAEDIVQDVFEKAIEKESAFRGDASYKTYLIRMTINRSYDYLRSWKYKQQSITNTIAQLINSETPEKNAILKDVKAQLGIAILKLKPKYRETIVLYYYEDFTTVEIAKLLGIPEGTVKTRLTRAREQLKNKLSGLEGVDFNA